MHYDQQAALVRKYGLRGSFMMSAVSAYLIVGQHPAIDF